MAPTPAIADGFKVYYLHGNIRCPTCQTIEATTQEAVETGFAEQLKSGQLAWQVINYESPGNEHYTTDYEVVAPTVVMAEFVWWPAEEMESDSRGMGIGKRSGRVHRTRAE